MQYANNKRNKRLTIMNRDHFAKIAQQQKQTAGGISIK